jgi:hypothetical protein
MAFVSWAYVAGFFDGEGCVGAPSSRTGVHVSVVQKSPRVLEEIAAFLESHGVTTSYHRNRSHPARMYSLHASSHEGARAWLEGMLPYLIVKRQCAEDAIQ